MVRGIEETRDVLCVSTTRVAQLSISCCCEIIRRNELITLWNSRQIEAKLETHLFKKRKI